MSTNNINFRISPRYKDELRADLTTSGFKKRPELAIFSTDPKDHETILKTPMDLFEMSFNENTPVKYFEDHLIMEVWGHPSLPLTHIPVTLNEIEDAIRNECQNMFYDLMADKTNKKRAVLMHFTLDTMMRAETKGPCYESGDL